MERVNALIKKDNTIMIAAIIYLGILIGAIAWIFSINDTKPIHLLEVDKESTGAYINTTSVPYGFASKVGKDSWLAIAVDENNYLYIVQLSNTQYDKIESYFENANDDASYEIAGVTRTIDTDISKLALDAYNKVVSEDKKIDEADFEKYFGNLYLEMGTTKDISLQVFIAVISSILFISFMIVGLISKNRTKKVLESDEYQKAIEEANTPELDTKNAILTKNYIIYYSAGLHIASYSDLAWIYRHTVTYNGVPNHSFVYYVKGNKKMNLIGFGLSSKRVDELISFISKKNPHILVGFTNENKKLFKEML